MWYIYTMEYYSAIKRNRLTDRENKLMVTKEGEAQTRSMGLIDTHYYK